MSNPSTQPLRRNQKRCLTLPLFACIAAALAACLLLAAWEGMRWEWSWLSKDMRYSTHNTRGQLISAGYEAFPPAHGDLNALLNPKTDPSDFEISFYQDSWVLARFVLFISAVLCGVVAFMSFRLHRSTRLLTSPPSPTPAPPPAPTPHDQASRSAPRRRRRRSSRLFLVVCIATVFCAAVLLALGITMRWQWAWLSKDHHYSIGNTPSEYFIASYWAAPAPRPTAAQPYRPPPPSPDDRKILLTPDGQILANAFLFTTAFLFGLIAFIAFRLRHCIKILLEPVDPTDTTDPRLLRCPHCRYDRTGLAPQLPCPECGHTLPLISLSASAAPAS